MMVNGVTATEDTERHHPAVYSAGRHGAWSHCSCGWTSGIVTGRDGRREVSVRWAEHLAGPGSDR